MLKSFLVFCLLGLIRANWNIDGKEYNEINIDGEIKKFLLYWPESLINIQTSSPIKVPLWVVLHGQTNNAMIFYDLSDFFLVAEDKKFVAVFPEGHCDVEVMCCWNTGHLRGFFDVDWGKNDIKVIDEIISEMFSYTPIEKVSIDQDKLIVTGYSAGGYMTHTYAINTTKHKIDTIIAVAGHVGGVSFPWQPPVKYYDPNLFGVQGEHRPNVIVVFGTEDCYVKIEGGEDWLGKIDFSMDQDVSFWKDQIGCDNPTYKSTRYDMNMHLTLTNYGIYCNKKIISVIANKSDHTWMSYDLLLEDETLEKKDFAKYADTLAELIYNLYEYEIRETPYPQDDPDPDPPTDYCYPYWPFYNTCGSCKIYFNLLMVVIIIAILFF